MGFLVVFQHPICANRPKMVKKRQKSAVFRKCTRFFLPTFGSQNRAFAHFFWPKMSFFVRTSSKISPQIGRSPLSQKEKWAQFCRFSKSVRTFFSSPNPSGLFVNQHNAAFDLEISKLTDIKQCMQQSVKSFVFLIDVPQSLESRWIRISLRILSRIVFTISDTHQSLLCLFHSSMSIPYCFSLYVHSQTISESVIS